ncbi:MAG: Ku protein [Planctomycetaceae bacterium]|nr:Ku protein [Planctomycetaceae bacterium]
MSPVAQKAAISFALVYIPVDIYTATQDNDIRFNQLSKHSNGRIRYKKFDEATGKEIANEDIVKGYQYDKDKYVVMTDEDFEKVKTEKDKSIQILQFSEVREISPVYYARAYYVAPQKGGEKAFELLRRTMLNRSKVAIGHTVMGSNEVVLALIPEDDGILMQTLYYDDEVRAMPKTSVRPEMNPAEMEMADCIVSGMEKPFEPAAFENHYQKRLRDLIESKIEGREIALPKESAGNNVINLMDALKASVDELHLDAKKPARSRKPAAKAAPAARRGRAQKVGT